MSSANTPSVRRVVAQHPAHRDDIGDLVTRRPLPGPGLALPGRELHPSRGLQRPYVNLTTGTLT